jgi:hypothetical protein
MIFAIHAMINDAVPVSLGRSQREGFPAMRRFTLGSATSRKIVVIELNGASMSVVQMMEDGSSKRQQKELRSEDEARSASERLAHELISRGYVEQGVGGSRPARPNGSSKPVAKARAVEEVNSYDILEDIEPPVAVAAPVLTRLATAPPAEPAPKKKPAGKKKKKKKKADGGDGLDKRVLAGIGAAAFVFFAFIGYIVYDIALKPPSIVGTWRGSLLEFETGGPIIHTRYDLILDEKKRASLTIQEKYTETGTYTFKNNRLKLALKNDDGVSSDREYKVSMNNTTLELLDPQTGKVEAELIRTREAPTVGGKAEPELPTPELAGDAGKVDKAADLRLAAVEFSPKDNAFKLRHPKGWEADTGSRPDNTYSWAKFTQDSATIQVYADVVGSLISGSDVSRDYPEGSEFAPVHRAHEHYKKAASEEFSDYKESTPGVFKDSGMVEGRISTFSASSGGLFGSKLRGYHVTLLSRDRRVTILCHCPEKEFPKYKATFQAVCRSFTR